MGQELVLPSGSSSAWSRAHGSKPEEVRLATGAGWNVEARRLRDAAVAPVVPIEAALGRYDRPAPALAGYDQLLAGATVLSDDAAAATVRMIGPCS